jgi:hypothetical protein
VNVGDQASRRRQFGGDKELGSGRELRDGVAVRLEEPSHGIAKALVVVDDGD